MQIDRQEAALSPDPTQAAQVADALLPYLRSTLEVPDLWYEEYPKPMAIGVETWVYGLSISGMPVGFPEDLVLRIFPPDADPQQALFEQTVQNAVIDLGYPAPRAPVACADPSVLGGTFVLMERVKGRMLLEAITEGEDISMLRVPRVILDAYNDIPTSLADAQVWLHELDAEALRGALKAAHIPDSLYTLDGWYDGMRTDIERAGIDGLRATMDWLVVHRPTAPRKSVICHADFLTPNLLSDEGELTGVIDWSHTTIAPPEWDIANTRLRIALNPFEMPPALKPLAAIIRPAVARKYYRAYASRRAIDTNTVQYYEVLLGLWMLIKVAQHRLAGEPPDGDDGRGGNPWFAPGATRPLIRYMRRITNTPITLPPGTAG